MNWLSQPAASNQLRFNMPTQHQLPVVSIPHSLFFSQAEKKAIQSEVPLG